LLRYREGTFQDVIADLDSAHSGITAMCRGIDGEPLFVVRGTGTFRYSGGKFEKLLSMEGLSNLLVISMANGGDGKVWMGTRDAGLFFMSNGRISAVTKGLPDRKINNLLAVGDSELWVSTDNGVMLWNAGEVTNPRLSNDHDLDHVQAFAAAEDRESNIWIGTGKGLVRLNAGGASSLEIGNDKTTGAVNAVFEDREGNLWVGSTWGIERLRDSNFMTYSPSGSTATEGSGPVYVDAEGRTWFAPSDGGLYWLKDGHIGQVKNAALDQDVIYSISGDKGDLWVGRQKGGLTHLVPKDGSFTTETYTRKEGLAQDSIYAVHNGRDGTVWAGSLSGGVTRFRDGKFTTYTSADGLASNTVTSIIESSDGTIWFGTAGGLSSLSKDTWKTYRGQDGLPPGVVNCLLEDSGGALWIGSDSGIAFLRSGRVEVDRNLPASLREPVLGVAEDRNGELWVSTSNHILRVDREKLLHGAISETDVREFGLADGLRSVEGVKRHNSVAKDPLGRIWFSTHRGLSVVNPVQVADISAPALAHIEAVTTDGIPVDLRKELYIPGSRQRIMFSYAGLSLSVPERVRFRYKLEGFDQDWSEPVASREAVYTNLGPGTYRFRVLASNSDGLWNGLESTLQFQIEPVLWQTWWFRLLCLAVIGLGILCLYRLRLHRLTRQLNLRFEERLAERTRIAQDLHDTLLQGFLSASMQLQVADDQLPADSPAKPRIDRVLGLMGQVIEEGRNAVGGLRSNRTNSLRLEEAFSRVKQELAIQEEFDFRVVVEGRPRPLHPLIRDEVFYIGREALVNAFHHSRARRIEVEVEYLDNKLRVLISDDGYGIDPRVLQEGREGHWGLSGMRERAERIGARLRVRSRVSAGTEVELSVPASSAFKTETSRPQRWYARLYRREAEGRLPPISGSEEQE
jgi:signal transduction histidine kinase/ligand-binding sensor domain-containing protein